MTIKSSDTESETPMTKHLNHPVMVEVFDVNLRKDDKMVELMSAKEARETSVSAQWGDIVKGIHLRVKNGSTSYFTEYVTPEGVEKLKALGYKVNFNKSHTKSYMISWGDDNV